MRKDKRIFAVCLAAVLSVSVLTGTTHLQAAAAVSKNPESGLRSGVQSYPSSSPLTSYNEDVAHLAYVTDVEDQAQTSYCWAYMADADRPDRTE